VGTVVDLLEGRDSRPIADAGLFVLDRVLLLFILAELLYTLGIRERASGRAVPSRRAGPSPLLVPAVGRDLAMNARLCA
jgi:hypothetical protein